jgi:thymidylate kinase
LKPGGDVLLAAVRSLRSTLGREPEPDEVVALLVDNQVPLLSLAGVHSPESTAVAASQGAIVERSRASELVLARGRADNPLAGSSESDLGERVVRSAWFDQAVARDREVYDEVQGNFAIAAQAWEARGVSSICFKSAGIAPSYPYTSENFDILFQAGDEPGAKAVLDDLGYVLLANCDEPQKWLYRLFVAGRSVSAIHLHTRVGWGQGFMIEPDIWKRRRRSADDPVTWMPGAEDVVLINTAHAFFENKAFGLHDLMKVRRAIADGVDWAVVEHVARERGWLPALRFSLAMMARLEERLFDEPLIPHAHFADPISGNPRMNEQLERATSLALAMPFATSWKLVKVLFFDKIIRDRHEPLGLKPTLVFLTLARAVKSQTDARPQNSALFTLSGIDGSGKTRQAESLLDAIDVCHLRAGVMWARLGATPAMHRLSRLWSREDGGESPGPRPSSGNEHALDFGTDKYVAPDNGGSQATAEGQAHDTVRPRQDGLPRMLWATLSSAEFGLWLLRIRWRLARGEIVIADRYLCDFDVELSAKLPSQAGFRAVLIRALSAIAPRPRRGFLLDLEAGDARRRAVPDGGDFDFDHAIQLYREKASRYGLVRVDAGEPFEAASAVVQHVGLRAYFNRYRMLGNYLFFMNPSQLNRPVRKQGEVGRVDASRASSRE